MNKKPLPRYEIRLAKNNEYYWIFIAKNGEEIAKSSETYTSKQNSIHSAMILNESNNHSIIDVSTNDEKGWKLLN